MPTVTVFTPTYNRASLLDPLYQSLLVQTNKSFVWLIVDDGSTDDTKSVVEAFQRENKIKIDYIYQENGGKHVAHNTGVEHCNTEIFFCVDSDDSLTEDGVEIILDNWPKIEADETLAGLIALRKNVVTDKVLMQMPENVERASIYNLYYEHHFKGDTAIAFKTSVIKQYMFPVFENERFVTEGAIYDLISQDYDMLLIDKHIYLHEYLDDGYSANIHRVHLKSPQGYMHFLKQRIAIAKDEEAYYTAISEYTSGLIMIRRNPFKNPPVPVGDMLKVFHHSIIRVMKILIKAILLKKIT